MENDSERNLKTEPSGSTRQEALLVSNTTSVAKVPLTFDLPSSFIDHIEACRRALDFASASEVVREAISNFDFESCVSAREPHRQISVRIPAGQIALLRNHARTKGVSVGELLRIALVAMPEKPISIGRDASHSSKRTPIGPAAKLGSTRKPLRLLGFRRLH